MEHYDFFKEIERKAKSDPYNEFVNELTDSELRGIVKVVVEEVRLNLNNYFNKFHPASAFRSYHINEILQDLTNDSATSTQK